jgi:Uma2 family endonuclease
MEAIAAAPVNKQSKKRSRKIPESLVYEIVDGKPIYYKGYRQVLNGKLNLEAVMAESSLQAWLKARLSHLLFNLLEQKGYEILTGELGLLIGRGDRRGADVSIYRREQLVLDAHYSKTPPEVIIEIDIQADLENQNEMEYVLRKIEDYLHFGVKKVIWIFTSNRKIMTATPQKPWLTLDWDASIETIEGATFNLEKMLEGRKIN